MWHIDFHFGMERHIRLLWISNPKLQTRLSSVSLESNWICLHSTAKQSNNWWLLMVLWPCHTSRTSIRITFLFNNKCGTISICLCLFDSSIPFETNKTFFFHFNVVRLTVTAPVPACTTFSMRHEKEMEKRKVASICWPPNLLVSSWAIQTLYYLYKHQNKIQFRDTSLVSCCCIVSATTQANICTNKDRN